MHYRLKKVSLHCNYLDNFIEIDLNKFIEINNNSIFNK